MDLNERQKKHLRRLGHALSPIVLLGNAGLTDGVLAEMDRALADHELVKVRTRCTLVSRVGNVGLFFRPDPKLSRIVLPA